MSSIVDFLNIGVDPSEEIARAGYAFAPALFGVGAITRVSAQSDVFSFPEGL